MKETDLWHVSLGRLRLARKEIFSSTNYSKGPTPDAVVFILGIDGSFNEASNFFVNFLLLDAFKNDARKIETNDDDDYDDDDFILVLRPDSVHIYCGVGCRSADAVFRLTTGWPDIVVHSLDAAAAAADPDAAEEFKIRAFKSMLKGCSFVGFSFFVPNRSTRTKFDPMMIERWPLIQAFAIEDVAGSSLGFFTLRHQVIDVSSVLKDKVFAVVDPLDVCDRLRREMSTFSRQMEALGSLIDLRGRGEPKRVVEHELEAVLTTYSAFGKLGRADEVVLDEPFVCFGRNTERERLLKRMKGREAEMSGAIENSLSAEGALHFIVNCVEPLTNISTTRTYFLHKSWTDDDDDDDDDKLRDATTLLRLYSVAMETTFAAINSYVASKSVISARSTVDEALASLASWEFRLEGLRPNGEIFELPEGLFVSSFKRISLIIFDIKSPDNRLLGSIAFAETFIDSAVAIDNATNNVTFLSVTSHVPRFLSWRLPLTAPSSGVLVKRDVLFNVAEAWPAEGDTPIRVHVSFNADRLVFFNDRLGKIQVNLESIVRIEAKIEKRTDDLGMSLSFKESVSHRLPIELRSRINSIYLFVSGVEDSDASRRFRNEAEPRFRQLDAEKVLEFRDNLSTASEEALGWLRLRADARAKESQSSFLCLSAKFRNLDQFLSHFLFSFNLDSSSLPVDHNLLHSNLKTSSTSTMQILDNPLDSNKIHLTLVFGLPGSFKENFASNITSLTSENVQWIVHCASETSPFSVPDFRRLLSSIAKSIQRRHGVSSAGVIKRAIVTVPGFVSGPDVIRSFQFHTEIRPRMIISRVVVCVNPENLFWSNVGAEGRRIVEAEGRRIVEAEGRRIVEAEGRRILPSIVETCGRGFVNDIIITGVADGIKMEEARTFFRRLNPSANQILAPLGHVTREADFDRLLSTDNEFNSTKMIRDRHLTRPGWWRAREEDVGQSVDAHVRKSQRVFKILVKTFALIDRNKLKIELRYFNSRDENEAQIFLVFGEIRDADGRRICVNFGAGANFISYLKESDNAEVARTISLTPRPPPPRGSQNDQNSSQTSADHSNSSSASRSDDSYLLFAGTRLQESNLIHLVRRCIKFSAATSPRQLLTRSNISTKELKEIQRLVAATRPLPDGCFFDGRRFVDFDGSRSEWRPDLEELVADWLERENELVERHNRECDEGEERIWVDEKMDRWIE